MDGKRKRQRISEYKIIERYSDNKNTPTFDEIMRSEAFKDIMRRILIKYPDDTEDK